MPLRNNLWNRIGALANAARKMRANFEGNGFVTAQLDGILRDLSADEVGEGTFTAALTKIKNLEAAVSGSGLLTADLAGFDPDSQAFITAAGITGETQQAALNQLVLDLKGSGSTTNNSDVWSDLQAVYPFCPIDGSTATRDAYKWNLKDPRDLDDAFRITWFNNPTASVLGINGNNSSAYGNTFFNPSNNAVLNSSHISCYKNSAFKTNQAEFGCRNTSSNVFEGVTFSNTLLSSLYNINTSEGRVSTTYNNNTSLKFRIIISRISSENHSVYQNGILLDSNTTNGGLLPDNNAYLFTSNGLLGSYDSSVYQFFTIGLGLTANQAKDLDDAITTYNTALGR